MTYKTGLKVLSRTYRARVDKARNLIAYQANRKKP